VRDQRTLDRIQKLAVPPAWTDVWICPDPHGHIQATGRDARGRKQYRYHPNWRSVRDAMKYHRVLAFGRALPRIRRRVEADLRRAGLPRAKVLATVVRLLEATNIRIGNGEYRRDNGSYGLTTLQDKHVKVEGARLRFRFRGKGGKVHEAEVEDPSLARVVRGCRALPGQELFQYVDDEGDVRGITSSDVNDYIRATAGDGFTAKDFRTWTGTLLAARSLLGAGSFRSGRDAQRNVNAAVERVAEQLGNTVAVAKRSYMHPGVLEAYLDGSLAEALALPRNVTKGGRGLNTEERALLRLLEGRDVKDPARLLAEAMHRTLRQRGVTLHAKDRGRPRRASSARRRCPPA
jgi:DNA topoisomerase I